MKQHAYHIGGTYQSRVDCRGRSSTTAGALSLARAVADTRLELPRSVTRPQFIQGVGRLAEGARVFNQALPLRRATGDREGELATLHNIGQITRRRASLQKRLSITNQGLSLVRAVGNRRERSYYASEHRAQFTLLLRDFQKALSISIKRCCYNVM